MGFRALKPRRHRRRTFLTRHPEPFENVTDLKPGDDDDFAIAVAVVPYISYAIGITHDAAVAYSAYDCGNEPYFQLTDAEHALAATHIAAHGADPGILIHYQEQRPPGNS